MDVMTHRPLAASHRAAPTETPGLRPSDCRDSTAVARPVRSSAFLDIVGGVILGLAVCMLVVG
jgi:hypothetical protein